MIKVLAGPNFGANHRNTPNMPALRIPMRISDPVFAGSAADGEPGLLPPFRGFPKERVYIADIDIRQQIALVGLYFTVWEGEHVWMYVRAIRDRVEVRQEVINGIG